MLARCAGTPAALSGGRQTGVGRPAASSCSARREGHLRRPLRHRSRLRASPRGGFAVRTRRAAGDVVVQDAVYQEVPLLFPGVVAAAAAAAASGSRLRPRPARRGAPDRLLRLSCRRLARRQVERLRRRRRAATETWRRRAAAEARRSGGLRHRPGPEAPRRVGHVYCLVLLHLSPRHIFKLVVVIVFSIVPAWFAVEALGAEEVLKCWMFAGSSMRPGCCMFEP